MNIFWLDNEAVKAAQAQCDKHVVKMTLETAQILTHVCHVFLPQGTKIPYKPLSKAHHFHPSVLWAMESVNNYEWLCDHGLALANEYTKRYKKTHKSEAVIKWAAQQNMANMPKLGLTPIKIAIKKDTYALSHISDPVVIYRTYYVLDKHKFAKWTAVDPPTWWAPLCNKLLTG